MVGTTSSAPSMVTVTRVVEFGPRSGRMRCSTAWPHTPALPGMLCRSSCRRKGSRSVPLSEEQKKSLVIATDRYAENLEGVLPYLESRGITEAIAHSRGLGLVRDPILEHKHARDRLSIPYVTP